MIQMLRRRPSLRAGLLLAPSAFWLIVFFIVPLMIVFVVSFLTRGTYGGVVLEFNPTNYQRFFDPLYLNTFARSFAIAGVTTIVCFIIGYPLAFFIATRPRQQRNIWLFALMIPFWTNFLIRTYAWLTILRTNSGLLNVTLMNLGLIQEPIPIFGTDLAIILGLTYGWLPDMVLPCYVALERLDNSLMEAASDLYANEPRAFIRIMFPLTLPGIVAGSLLVFIPSLGAFITPALLGGSKSLMIGNIVYNQFLGSNDWPFGAAISFVMMAIMLVATMFYIRTSRREA